MIPCRHLNPDGTQTVCGKPSTHAYKISGFISINQSIICRFNNHLECRCDDHMMDSFLPGLEFIEIPVDEAIVRQIIDS